MLDNTEPSKNKKDYFNSNQEIHATKTEKGASKIDFYDHQGKNKRRVVHKERIGVKSVPKGRVGKNIQMIETNDEAMQGHHSRCKNSHTEIVLSHPILRMILDRNLNR